MELHGLDTETYVFFYEQDYYVLSNFSAFEIEWSGFVFKTSEHLYHWLRFTLSDKPGAQLTAGRVKNARSAHDAFKMAQAEKVLQADNWDNYKTTLMREILRAKAAQHEYVRRKLLATGDRELIENSWRDGFWGWGPDRAGKNVLGKLWMEVRAELRAHSQRTNALVSEDGSPRAPGIDPETREYSTAQLLLDEMQGGDTSEPLFD